MAEHGLSRRGLLSGAAAGGAILAIGGLGEAAEAATTSGSLPTSVDAVVVGGGLSGLVAARNLVKSGKRVLVLEARNRVGGRLLNHTLKGGSVIESGGAFVGPTQNHVLALAKELKVETFKEYVTGDNVYVSKNLGTMKYTGTVPPDPLILADAAILQLRIDDMASKVPVDAPWTAPDAANLDATTVDSWLRQNTVIPQVREVLKAFFQAAFGTDAEGISMLFFLWYMATAGDETHPGTFERASGHRRCRAGLTVRWRLRPPSAAHRLGAGLAGRAQRPGAQDQADEHRSDCRQRPRHRQGQAGHRRGSSAARPGHRLVTVAAAQAPAAPAAHADGHLDEGRRGLCEAVLARQGIVGISGSR